jgi:hypothetical protein
MKSNIKLKNLLNLKEEIGFLPGDLEEDLALAAKISGYSVTIKDIIQLLNAIIDSRIKPDDAFELKPKKNTRFQREKAMEKRPGELWNKIEKKYKGELKGNQPYSIIRLFFTKSGFATDLLKQYKPYRKYHKY